ncbi:sce7725 family protein [Enterobacter bugandensis]|uniref:sce7725 family protein n=1 Tax=Enterobacter bugandensis TaxID=881260 RepID=UPI0032AFFA4D
MYYPYFRGKQFELIAIRETAETMAQAGFIPIIEPVKETLNGLEKTLKAICEAKGKAIVIVNPSYGDHSTNGHNISQLLKDSFHGHDNIFTGILLNEGMDEEDIIELLDEHAEHQPCFIHSGFSEPRSLSEKTNGRVSKHIFLEHYCGKLYRKHFNGCERILIRDGFKKRKNADYPPIEEFSDLHITFGEEGMDGFGDFLIVGDDYTEGGGPAYAVAIHLTFLESKKENVMYIYHFVSTTRDTPTDPAGKFGQALEKLITTINENNSPVLETSAILEFRALHAKGHFPGLGTVKKLSMRHHVETLANYFRG